MRFLALTAVVLSIPLATSLPLRSAYAQRTPSSSTKSSEVRTSDKLFPVGKVEEKVIYDLDPARERKLMDATPDGSRWFVVDAFAGWQRLTMNGHVFSQEFHDIPRSATRLSPNGDYVVWAGQMRATTKQGFDSSVTYVYRDTSMLGSYVSDYPDVEFSRSGERWAMLLPYANAMQQGDRDLVMVDGSIVSKGYVSPHQFSFSHNETEWAYRSTNGMNEDLVTSDGKHMTLYTRTPATVRGDWDATVWYYTPDVTYLHKLLEGRDYDLNFAHVARQYRTAFSSRARDTVRTYVAYEGKAQGLYRWISNVMIDTAGKHIAYFACDPSITRRDTTKDEQRGVVVYDGKVAAGPYSGVARLFLSPSGEHYAYSLEKSAGEFYLDKKRFAKTAQIMDCVWSPDEKTVAFSAVGEHDKVFVVVGGKRSPLFEQIGRIGWTKDGQAVEFVGVENAKVIKVRLAP